MVNEWGKQLAPWALERALRGVRSGHGEGAGKTHANECPGCLIPGLPTGFRYQDLRHYFASLLIASGADVKVVQARMWHASAKTTLDTYGHLWPDSTRAAVSVVMAARADYLRTTGTE